MFSLTLFLLFFLLLLFHLVLRYVIGTFAAHPLVLGSMNAFLRWVMTPKARKEYTDNRKLVKDWSDETNAILEKEGIPLRTASYASVWTMLYKQPGRYHWMLQYYLKDEGINLSWVGTGRLNFSLDFKKADLEKVRERKEERRVKEMHGSILKQHAWNHLHTETTYTIMENYTETQLPKQ